MVSATVAGFGARLRAWREQRRLTQLDLAGRAAVSTRHLSFLETGRSRPSREMVLHLCDQLEVPLRERNALLVLAGLAPEYPSNGYGAAAMTPIRNLLGEILARHEPYPAIVVDGQWDVLELNPAASAFTVGLADHLLEPPINVIRASLHPEGLAPRITNFAEYAAHVVGRLRRMVELSADPVLAALHREVIGYPGVGEHHADPSWLVLPLHLRAGEGELRFVTTITTFGAPLDVIPSELAVESFYPADDATRAAYG